MSINMNNDSTTYYADLINGWTGVILVSISQRTSVTAIGGYITGTNATSDIFAKGDTTINDCISDHRIPVPSQAAKISLAQDSSRMVLFALGTNVWNVSTTKFSGSANVCSVYARSF